MDGNRWKGKGELWLDPLGNTGEDYECEISIKDDSILYSWFYKGEVVEGRFTFESDGVTWVDGWHQKEAVPCISIPEAWGVFTAQYEYGEDENAKWGWRIKLSERPDGSLVLQMTNIAPWGEESRAVRMIFDQR
ncbi:MAG: hypothetical protein AAGJ81_09870 [Verrucomicrobiota bacterium]